MVGRLALISYPTHPPEQLGCVPPKAVLYADWLAELSAVASPFRSHRMAMNFTTESTSMSVSDAAPRTSLPCSLWGSSSGVGVGSGVGSGVGVGVGGVYGPAGAEFFHPPTPFAFSACTAATYVAEFVAESVALVPATPLLARDQLPPPSSLRFTLYDVAPLTASHDTLSSPSLRATDTDAGAPGSGAYGADVAEFRHPPPTPPATACTATMYEAEFDTGSVALVPATSLAARFQLAAPSSLRFTLYESAPATALHDAVSVPSARDVVTESGAEGGDCAATDDTGSAVIASSAIAARTASLVFGKTYQITGAARLARAPALPPCP